MTIPPLSEENKKKSLSDLSTQGFSIIENFLDPAECDRLRGVFDSYIQNSPGNIQGNPKSDDRIFAAEYVDPVIRDFKYHATLKDIASTYVGTEQNTLFTMANRLIHRPGVNIRSGGRWHRDRKKRQFKSMVYLSDVSPENGPFSILPTSAIGSGEYTEEIEKAYFQYDEQRWDDSAISAFLELVDAQMRVCTASKGTVVLFDSSLIHSGQRITAGNRYAMTNYFYAHDEVDLDKVRSKWGLSAGLIEF